MTASITARAGKGRAPSWTRTTRHSGRTAASPAATESARSVPPATSVNAAPWCWARKAGGVAASAGGRTSTRWATSGWAANGRTARSTRGTPARGRYCLAVPPLSRELRPAATTITPTSRGKRPDQLLHVLQADERDAGHLDHASRAAEDPTEAEPGRLGETPLGGAAGTDLTAEADLAEEDDVRRRRPVVEAGEQGRGHGQVGAGLGQPHTGRDLDEHVQIGERGLRPALQHGEEN